MDSKTSSLELDEKELKNVIKNFYEQFGSLIIRRDKRYNSYNCEIRFYANEMLELNHIRRAMSQLGFSEGSPIVYKKKERCYVPYYGKEQVIRFIQLIKPNRKNDISLICRILI